MKIAVYGSRSWADRVMIERALPASFTLLTLDQPGACAIASQVARERAQPVEVGELRFTTFDRKAVMVALGDLFNQADLILVFTDGSEGAVHALELARRSGRAVRAYGPEGEMKEWSLGEKPSLF